MRISRTRPEICLTVCPELLVQGSLHDEPLTIGLEKGWLSAVGNTKHQNRGRNVEWLLLHCYIGVAFLP